MIIANPSARMPAKQRSTHITNRVRTGLIALAAAVVVAGTLASTPAQAAPAGTIDIFSDNLKPTIAADNDRSAVEIGLRFSPQTSGEVTALQYYQSTASQGVTTASLWSSRGTLLSKATFSPSTETGWRTVSLASPVKLSAERTYVVSYHAPRGGYAVIQNDLTESRTQNGFTLPAGAGVYSYGSSTFPSQSYKGSNYLVDVIFKPAGGTPSPTPTSSPTTKPSPSPSPTSSTPPKPSPSPTTPQSSDPPASGSATTGWTVNASTVGLQPLGLSCDSLPVYSGSSSVPKGTVISGKRVNTPLDLSAGGITIERSCIAPTVAWRGLPILSTKNSNTMAIASTKVTIRDSEISGALLGQEDAAWATGFMGVGDLSRNYFHDLGSGIAVMHSGDTEDMLIEQNYVTRLIAWGNAATTGNHTDAFTVRDFSAAKRADRQLIIRNNRFDANSGNDTGALFVQTYSGRIDNVTIQGNLLEGLGYQLGVNQLNSPYSNINAANNRFSGTGFGPTYVQRGPGWSSWQDNYVYNANAADGKGALVREPWPAN